MAKHDASFLSQAQITHRIPGLVGVRLPDNVVLDFKVSTRIHVTMSLILITGHSKALCPTTGYTAKDWRLLPCVLRGALINLSSQKRSRVMICEGQTQGGTGRVQTTIN